MGEETDCNFFGLFVGIHGGEAVLTGITATNGCYQEI
jgi:hypothetical protein